MHRASESDRVRDVVYQILTDASHPLREQISAAVVQMICDYSKHPAIIQMTKHSSEPVIQKALILAAIYMEPDFLTYMMNMNQTCSSTLSEYVAHVLPPLIERLLNGATTIPLFVEEATHAYVRL